MKILIGWLEQSEGRAPMDGLSVVEDLPAFQRRLGYVPEEPHLSGREYLQLAERLRGIPRAMLEARIDGFLRLFSLWSDRGCAGDLLLREHALRRRFSQGKRFIESRTDEVRLPDDRHSAAPEDHPINARSL
jgi:ABC-type multidrug transport system ATPase subunit